MVDPEVYEALAMPIVGHLDPLFLALMDELQDQLRRAFRTTNPTTLAVSGTGSAGMEAALVNLLEPGEHALVLVNGAFGERMCQMVDRIGARAHRLERPWGEVFDIDQVARKLDALPAVRVVCVVHAETSTGALQPIEGLGRLCRDSDRLLVVDAVTSLGGTELRVDDWRIDACYSGTQKCLSCPPGLAPITFGRRAVDRIRKRRRPVGSWYLDVTLVSDYWTEGSRTYHHTAPISMNFALHRALELLHEEGLEARFARHRRHGAALVSGLEALGFSAFTPATHRLPMLAAVELPAGVEDAPLRRRLLDDYDIEVGGGLAGLAGRVWRIGLMGAGARKENVHRLLEALEELLSTPGGRDAAESAYGAIAVDEMRS